jgi:aminopeptidase N
LFLDESATQGQLLGRASVIAHETAHMWFGDLVTMRWFDDVWMKEVFANFMAAKIVNPSFPELDHDLRFLLAHYPAAYAVDRTEGANPIRQPLENLSEAGSLYGAIIYQKAPIVMRQLELLVGEDAFRDGLREYLDSHRYGNATWPDLIAVLDRLSPLDLVTWSRTWVEEPGRPTIETRVESTSSGASVTFRQEDPRGRGLQWEQTIRPWVGSRQERPGAGVRLAPDASVRTEGRVDFVLPNGDGLGYGLFRQTDASRAWLLAHLREIPAPVPRAVAWVTLWDELLEGDVPPLAWVDMAARSIESEGEELLVSRMLADLDAVVWRVLTPAQRADAASRLEGLVWSRLESAEPPSLKASFFNAYVDLATTPEALSRIETIWREEDGVPGLPLSERDLTGLAQQLAVREVDGAEGILDVQAVRIRNPDRRAEYDFVRPALSADPGVRDRLFASLSNPVNREREPWVLAAVGFLQHPTRSEQSLGYIRPSLELLEEIQRTGDIFFPQRWLDATLGGHGSPAAAEVVRAFLAERPEVPARLKGKLLQSSDFLFRAATMRDPDMRGPGRGRSPD